MNPSAGKKIPAGTLFEYRIARLRFAQGYFVRRSIDLWPSGLEGNKLAELDCLALSLDPQLKRSLEIVECKTGASGQGEIDRLIWLKGMGNFARARAVTFAKPRIADRTRDFAHQLGVNVLDEAAVTAIEQGLGIASDWWPGFHDPQFGEDVVKPARMRLNSSAELRKVGKYLYGSFWFTDDFTRIKQLQTFFRLVEQHSAVLTPEALMLGVGEATVLFALTVLSIASWRNQLASEEFRRLVEAELSRGLGDPRSLRTLLQQVDELQRHQIEALHSAYQQKGIGRVIFPVRSLEAEILAPQEWVEAFSSLVSRFWTRAHLASDVIRWIDLWAANLLGANQSIHGLGEGEDRRQAALDLIIAFLTRHWGVPSHLLAPAQQTVVGSISQSQGPSGDTSLMNATPEFKDSSESTKSSNPAPVDQEK